MSKKMKAGPFYSVSREFLLGFHDFTRKLVLAFFIGFASGFVGLLFRLSISWMNELREGHTWLIAFLPLTGLLIFASYRWAHYQEEPGFETVSSSIHRGDRLSSLQAPLVFLASSFTHLFGGSAGREGAALELGACTGAKITRLFHWDQRPKFKKLSILCGMCGAFSALFGAPITAFFFVLEITGPKIFHYRGGIFAFVSSLTAFALLLPIHALPEALPIFSVPSWNADNLFQIFILIIFCGIAGWFYCIGMRLIPKMIQTLVPNGYFRIAGGGLVILLFTLLSGTFRYNGLGGAAIEEAFQGQALPSDPIRKTILTAITLGSGYKGGDLIPSLFVGATTGALVAPFFSLSSGFCAAFGLITVFCITTRCRLAAIALAVELFGIQMVGFATLVAVVAYLFSGKWSSFRR